MKEVSISKFYCTQCGHCGIPIPRKKGAYRESGHLKRLYCVNCQRTVNHVEIRDLFSDYNYEDFLIEFNGGNFDSDGNRIEPSYKKFRSQKGVETNE